MKKASRVGLFPPVENNGGLFQDNEAGPWCYTTDVTTRWEFCDVCAKGEGHRAENIYLLLINIK